MRYVQLLSHQRLIIQPFSILYFILCNLFASGPVSLNSSCAAKHYSDSQNLILICRRDPKVSKETKEMRLILVKCVTHDAQDMMDVLSGIMQLKTWSLGFDCSLNEEMKQGDRECGIYIYIYIYCQTVEKTCLTTIMAKLYVKRFDMAGDIMLQ